MQKKVGIVCAGDREVAPFMKHIENVKIVRKAKLNIYEGTIAGVQVVVLYSGVCKVNAAIAAQILIDQCGVDIIINAGTAGGMDEKLEIFDIVISAEVVYHDVAEHILTEFHPWMENVYFQADRELIRLSKLAAAKLRENYKIHWGRIATGESFITDAGRKEINEKFAPLSVDMETASIAHVCFVNEIPFISIRCITDTAMHSGVGAFEENCDKASVIAKNVTLALLEEIRENEYMG